MMSKQKDDAITARMKAERRPKTPVRRSDPTHINELVADPNNRRVHNPRNVGMVADALQQVGAARSIVIDEDDVVLAGNGVTAAAAQAGITAVRVIEASGHEIIAVRRRGLTPEQKRALALYDNRTAELAEWNLALLQSDKDAHLSLQPFWSPEEEAILLRSVAGKAGKTDPDAVPELRATTIVRGDLFELGAHRLLCGDSTSSADVGRLLGTDRVALIATDPPYGVDYAAIVDGRANQKRGGWRDIAADTAETMPNLEALVRQAFLEARPYAGKGCAVLVWHPSGENYATFRVALSSAGVHVMKQIIWVKPTLVFGRHEYHWRHEPAMYGWFEGSRAHFYGDRSETTVWEIDYSEQYKVRNGPAMAQGGLGLHPTQKPVEIFARPIRNHTHAGDVVYEPFSGSGSALIAAETHGRACRAMEIDPSYCQVAVDRWQQFAGKPAVKISSGAPAAAPPPKRKR